MKIEKEYKYNKSEQATSLMYSIFLFKAQYGFYSAC